jgi:uncharacterized protein (TIGR00725 family)
MRRARTITVIGAGEASASVRKLAYEVGLEVARRGAVLINGGRTGVMEAAAAGARSVGGHTIGILPSYDRSHANRHIEFAIATGMGEARNAIIVASADAVIALEGEGGTLAEIGFAKKMRRPIVALKSWPEISGLRRAKTPAEAVTMAFKLCAGRAK